MSTKTTNYNFTKPAENEYYDVNVQNDNWDKADDALTKKVTAAGGDIANTIVSAIDASTASFPVPAAKDKPRTLWGKVKKWQEDCIAKFGNYVLKSMISSQQINDSSKVPSSALAYLMQQAITENANDISVLNTNRNKDVTVDDLIATFSVPTFVHWNANTANTPYKDGITSTTLGWAIIYGSSSNMLSIFSGAMGTDKIWSRVITQSTDTGWNDVVLDKTIKPVYKSLILTSNFTSYGLNYSIKSGKLLFLHMGFTTKNAVSSGADIAQIVDSGDIAPINNIAYGSTAHKLGIFKVDSGTKNLRVGSDIEAGQTFIFNLVLRLN